MSRSVITHPAARKCMAIVVSVIVAISGFPSIAVACEGGGEEWILGEEKGGDIDLAVFAPNIPCEGKIKVLDVSSVGATIKILKEAGIECNIALGGELCKNVVFTKNGEKCESILEKVSKPKDPLYELEVQVNGNKPVTRKFAA